MLPLIITIYRKKKVLLCAIFLITGIFPVGILSKDDFHQLIIAVKKGPRTYYTSQAYSFFTKTGETLYTQKSRDEASESFKAVIRLAEMGTDAKSTIGMLIDIFPKAVHVTEVKNVHYSGEGTFEDWVQTYVTSEKNKFLLSAPFLDYATLSKCEDFIKSTHQVRRANGEAVTIPTKDVVVISVVHTVYFGAFALKGITGQNLGFNQSDWRSWWTKNNATFSSTTPVGKPSTGPIVLLSGQSFEDIVLHGKYRMFLSTRDSLTGRVESKDAESLILETSDGKAFTFRPNLILRYEYLEPPRATPTTGNAKTGIDSLPFSFDELRGRRVGKRVLEIRINSGMVFRGTLNEINKEMLKLQVGKSVIPITRDVVVNIRLVPPQPEKKTSQETKKSVSTKLDTVIVRNPESNDWGKPKPDITYTGRITGETSEDLTINVTGSGSKKIPRGRIVRVVKHSTESYQDVIQRYAKPLFCPKDMFLVDLPPGKQGRPFFKVCVDRYEYPNVKDARPKTNISYDDARTLCHKRGKRLCTSTEWQWACSGIEGYTYPYGWNPEENKCNTDDRLPPEASGARHNCVSKFGGFDMVGNVFEWVTGPENQPSLVGGPNTKCQTITKGVGGSAKPRSGFRCCKSN